MTAKEDFIKKWSTWWILTPGKDKLNEAFEKELNELIPGETTVEDDNNWLITIPVTSCCKIGPITSENYCPNCGKKITKSKP